jgi:Subtilase family
MRWIFVLLVTLLACLGQAQEEDKKEQIAFLIRSKSVGGIDPEQLKKSFVDQGGVFSLETITPDNFIVVNQGEKAENAIPGVIAGIAPNQELVPLDGNTPSVCSGLFLGRVSFDGEITAKTLQDLEKALTDAGVIAIGVDGEGSHASDMARPSKSGAEDVFLESSKALDAQSRAYNGGGSNNIIAILDTGVTADSSNPLLGTLETAIKTNMGQYKVDYIEFDSVPQDEYEDYMNGSVINKGHGTPIALLAHTVANQADILPIRVCNGEGQCPTTRIILGVCHAINVAAETKKKLVINMSFSGVFPAGFDPKQSSLYQLLRLAVSVNTLVATEVGNRGLDPNPRYPAAFTNVGLDGLVSVSGLEPYGNGSWTFVPASYSTRGNYIDVAALGSNIYINKHIVGDAGYKGGYSGSSFATPWVTGALSLMLEANAQRLSSSRPLLTAWEIEYCLAVTTQPPMPPVILQQEVGAGMIDIAEAITCVELFPNYPY